MESELNEEDKRFIGELMMFLLPLRDKYCLQNIVVTLISVATWEIYKSCRSKKEAREVIKKIVQHAVINYEQFEEGINDE